MRDVMVVGVHTIPFGKYLDRSVKDLAAWTLSGCLKDAGLDEGRIQALWFSNSVWGEAQGQTSIRGQVALRPAGISRIPITNVENACASGATAFHHAWLAVASGLYDLTMAIGVEKLYRTNKVALFAGFLGGIDVENCLEIMKSLNRYALTHEDLALLEAYKRKYPPEREGYKKRTAEKGLKERLKSFKDQIATIVLLGERIGYDTVRKLNKVASGDHSPFMDIYGYAAREHMKKFGTTVEQLAMVAAKNHFNSTLNPNAQFRFEVSMERVLADRLVSFPLTRAMCAPIGDGAAAALLCSFQMAKELGLHGRGVRIRASVLGSGQDRPPDLEGPDIGSRLAQKAYDMAGVGPKDIDLAEVHDATAYGEICQTENLGFCPRGDGGRLAEEGATRLGGRIPVNSSGGLISRGHPIGASGLAQIHELVTQLRGLAGKRQAGRPKMALAENGGGMLGWEEAAMGIHILEAPDK